MGPSKRTVILAHPERSVGTKEAKKRVSLPTISWHGFASKKPLRGEGVSQSGHTGETILPMNQYLLKLGYESMRFTILVTLLFYIFEIFHNKSF